MRSKEIEQLIEAGREIEFEYRNSRYSITYFNEDCEKPISVCKFYEQPINVRSANEVLKLTIGSRTLKEIFESLPDSAFDIF